MTSLPEGIEDGEVLKKITGKITKLYPAEEQAGQFGTYKRQKGEIEIGGQTLHLYITSNEQPQSARGKTVTLESIKDEKTKAFKGVQYVIEKFTPKKGANAGKEVTQEVIKVNGSAVVTYEGGAPAGDAPAAKTTNSAPNRQTTGVVQSTSVVYPEPQSLQDLLNQIAYQHALTDATVRNAYKDDKYDEETLRAYVASVWIEANRQGANRFYTFEKEVEKAKAQEPAKEEQEQAAEEDIPWDNEKPKDEEPDANPFGDWASVQVPDGKNKGTMLAKVGKVWIQKAYDAYKVKGFDTDFKKFVKQAAIDLGIAKEEEEGDDIPM